MTKKSLKLKIFLLDYKPSPYLLSSLVKYQKKKYKIEDFVLESIWQNDIKYEEFKKLHNFFWFFSLRFEIIQKNNSISC